MKYDKIHCVAKCGGIHLLTGDIENKTQEQKCVSVKYDPELCPAPEVTGKYETMATPMTFNPFNILTANQTEVTDAVLERVLTEKQKEEIYNFLT